MRQVYAYEDYSRPAWTGQRQCWGWRDCKNRIFHAGERTTWWQPYRAWVRKKHRRICYDGRWKGNSVTDVWEVSFYTEAAVDTDKQAVRWWEKETLSVKCSYECTKCTYSRWAYQRPWHWNSWDTWGVSWWICGYCNHCFTWQIFPWQSCWQDICIWGRRPPYTVRRRLYGLQG